MSSEPSSPADRPLFIGIAIDLAIFALATSGTYLAQIFDRPITAVLIYLMGVIAIGARSGLRRGIYAALTASVIYNFFLSEPAFRFGASSTDEVVPLIAFNLSALLTGAVAGQLKDRAAVAREAESKNAYLLELSDRLQRAIDLDDVRRIARLALPMHPVIGVTIFVRDSGPTIDGERLAGFSELDAFLPAENEDGAVRSCLFEMVGSQGDLGLVKYVLESYARGVGLPDLQAVTNLLALAVERCLLSQQLSETRTRQRGEELKSAILSSVSHDLRTPLTAIEAAATSLLSYGASFSDEQRKEMLVTISSQCTRLNRFTSNLLDMGRIQSGISTSNFEDVDVAEILGVALVQIRQRYPDQVIEKQAGQTEFMTRAKASMVEQVLINVLENAIVHGSFGKAIAVRLTREGGNCVLSVSDQGPGIPAEDQAHVFERFFRSDQLGNHQGSGLGLYIAKGFLEAFGGDIALESPCTEHGYGTKVILTLPLVQSEARP